MRAIDTNVLVRFLVNDDPAQTAQVRALLEKAEKKGDTFLVSIPVVLETVWVLDSSYSCSREDILKALQALTSMRVFRFEAPERLRALLEIADREPIGIADALIGLTAIDLGCESTLTFDRRAAKSALFTPVP